MLVVIVILGILSGMSVLAFGSSSDNTEATAILSNLDAAKNAVLAYANSHKTRNMDPLVVFNGKDSSVVLASLDSYLGGQTGEANAYFQHIRVSSDNGVMRVGFFKFPANLGVGKALTKKVASAGAAYSTSSGDSKYELWLNIR
jgi:type II secretory pathway pseudopilin PulG